jgi:hypothetical protein
MGRKKYQKLYSKYDKRKRRPCQWTLTKVVLCVMAAVGLIFSWSRWTATVSRMNFASSSSPFLRLPSAVGSKATSVSLRTVEQATDHTGLRFVIFHRLQEAQGAGNHMHGLLAAHLLGDEFDRVVCVSQHYKDFHMAFEPADPVAMAHCPDILDRHNKEPPLTRQSHTIELLNYRMHGPNECALQKLLSSTTRVLHLNANTYPRWPQVPPHIHFFAYYKAKPSLLDILPYPQAEPPTIVVHLRQADKDGDSRRGVDEASLRALGKLLPLDTSRHSPFVVTNNVPWFDFFEEKYSWSHPYWTIVMHSALGNQVSTRGKVRGFGRYVVLFVSYILRVPCNFKGWEGRAETAIAPKIYGGNANQVALQKKYKHLRKEMGVDDWEIMQLWADWYTLLKAEKVYHTFSDFSLSAVHWMNTWSRTYDGLDPNTGKPLLLEENWVVDGVTPRLIDRTPDNLRNC